MVEGRKDDQSKIRFSILPWSSLVEIVKVLEFGAKKYAPDNWMKVPNAETRYFDAAMRHLVAWQTGERTDSETGLSHLAHAVCCGLFLLWFDKQPSQVKYPLGTWKDGDPVTAQGVPANGRGNTL